jgi:hypothetical protein
MRYLAALGVVSLVAGIALAVIDIREHALFVIPLLLIAFGIAVLVAIGVAYRKLREVAADARRFVKSDRQQARLAEVGDPRGLIFTRSTVALELEGDDGAVHRLGYDIPIPFPAAWSFRIGKRLGLPLLGKADLTRLLAFELRREGLRVGVGRPEPR